jgi:hypothetical protein
MFDVLYLNALIYVTLQVAMVLMAVHRQLLDSHYLLYMLGTFYLPTLSVISVNTTKSARYVAAVFAIAGTLSMSAFVIVTGIMWWIQGAAYLGLAAANKTWTLWLLLGFAVLMVANGVTNAILLLENREIKAKET